MEEISNDNLIVIKRNNKKILVIDKIKRSQAYCDSIKEINETLRELGM